MEFENEPEGWDDHIIQNPPGEKDRETIEESTSGLVIVSGLVITVIGALAMGFGALVWRMVGR